MNFYKHFGYLPESSLIALLIKSMMLFIDKNLIYNFWWWLLHCSEVLDFMKFDILEKIFCFFLFYLSSKFFRKRIINFKYKVI